MHLLAGDAIDTGESGAQGFVAQDQRLQRCLEMLDMQHAAQARHAADVVRRAVRFHLPEEPHALLRIGQRHRLAAVDFCDRQLLIGAAADLDQANLFGVIAQFAVLEQCAQRQFDVTGLTCARNDLRGQQRVTAEGEEIITQANLLQTQHFAPDRGDLLLQFADRLDMFTHLPLRLGQGAAVEFAAGTQRHRIKAQQLCGHHVFRQLSGQSVVQSSDLLVGIFLRIARREVADQLSTGSGFAHQHHGLGDAILRQQSRLDFFRFNAKAAQLDLLIETAEVFDHAIRGPARTVAGAVQAGALLAQWIDDKTLGGQRRTPEITTRQTDAADAQLTRHTRWHWIEIGIENAADHIAQRPANRRALTIGSCAVPMGDIDRGFSRAITVVQLHRRQLRQHTVAQLGGQGFTAGKHPAQAGALGTQRLVDEQRQQRRDEVQRGHAVLLDQLRDAMRVAVLAGGGKQQTRAGDQRPEAFPHRDVETDRRFLHQHVGFVETVCVLHPLQALGQRGVGVADAFRLPGGTRGVNHVGEVVAVHSQSRCLARPFIQVQRIHGDHADAIAGRQTLEQLRLGQEQFDAAVAEHVREAFGRIIRIKRHIGAAGLDDRQQTDQQLRRTLGSNGHAHVRANAFVAQVMGEPVGLRVQLGKIQTTAVPHQRGALRGVAQLLLEQFRQPLLRRGARSDAPVLLLILLAGGQQAQIADGLLWLFADLAEQIMEMLGQTLDGRGIEQFAGVVERQAQTAVAILFAVQLQIELGLAAVPRQFFGEQTGQALECTEVALLMVEHDLEQSLFAGLRERFEQLFERQILMGLGAECGLAGLVQQLGKCQARIDLRTQHLGIDEEADQALGFQARTVGVGHADANVALTAVAVQQTLQRSEQKHERRGLVGLRGLADRLAEFATQAHAVACGAVVVSGRARVIGGQFQWRMFFAQLRFPVRQLPLALALRQPLPLPVAVVGVLHRQRCQRRRCTLGSGGIETREFVEQDIQRPAVSDDVVQGHQQLMFFVIETHQCHRQQRAFFQIEPSARLVFANLLGTGFTLWRWQVADVDQLQVEFGSGEHLLQCHAVALEETCAQGFVAFDQLLEAAAHGVFVQLATQAQAAGNVVGAALWIELPSDPQTVLCQRLRHRLAARQGADRTLSAAAVLF